MARKSLKEELRVVKYMAELEPKFFKVLKEALDNDDKKWAVEQLAKLFAKAVPQKIGGDPDNRTPIPLLYALHNNDGNKKDIQPN